MTFPMTVFRNWAFVLIVITTTAVLYDFEFGVWPVILYACACGVVLVLRIPALTRLITEMFVANMSMANEEHQAHDSLVDELAMTFGPSIESLSLTELPVAEAVGPMCGLSLIEQGLESSNVGLEHKELNDIWADADCPYESSLAEKGVNTGVNSSDLPRDINPDHEELQDIWANESQEVTDNDEPKEEFGPTCNPDGISFTLSKYGVLVATPPCETDQT